MVRAAAKNHPSRRHRHLTRARTTTCWPPSPPAASPSTSGSASPPRRSCTPRRTTSTSRRGWATCSPTAARGPASRRGWAPRGAKEAVLRYGENPHQSGRALRNGYRPEGRPRPGRAAATARRCPTTTTSTPTRPAGRRTTSTSRPWRSSSTPTRAASRSATTWPTRTARRTSATRSRAFGGVIATNVAVSVAMAEQVAEIFTEVIVAPAYEDGAIEVLQAKKNIRILECPPLARGGAELRSISGGLLLQQRDVISRRGRRPLHLDPRHRGGRLRGGRWPTWRSRGAPAAP